MREGRGDFQKIMNVLKVYLLYLFHRSIISPETPNLDNSYYTYMHTYKQYIYTCMHSAYA